MVYNQKCMHFYVQNCGTHRSGDWETFLEINWYLRFWCLNFLILIPYENLPSVIQIISEKGSSESGQMASYKTQAGQFCSDTLLCFLIGRVRLRSDTINMCSKKPLLEIFCFPVAIVVHRDCSGWQDHWNTVHVSHDLFPPHLIWRAHWANWGHKQMKQSQQPPYIQHLAVLL